LIKGDKTERFVTSLESTESQDYRYVLQMRWRQNHSVIDTLLTLLSANPQHLAQHYCRIGPHFLNWSSLGKMRMRCGMTRHQWNRKCNSGALCHKVKCNC